MRSRIALFAIALVLGTVLAAAAQAPVELSAGTVIRLDPQASVVVLDDGRMFRVTPSTVLLVDNRPATFTTLRTGERVVIRSAEPVAFRDGRYITVQSTPPAVAVTPAPPVVTQAPAPTVVVQPPPPAAAPAGVRQTLYGTIADVDRDGKVKIKTDRDSFEARLGPEALRSIRKGDNVVIDLTIVPPGTPAASPR